MIDINMFNIIVDHYKLLYDDTLMPYGAFWHINGIKLDLQYAFLHVSENCVLLQYNSFIVYQMSFCDCTNI